MAWHRLYDGAMTAGRMPIRLTTLRPMRDGAIVACVVLAIAHFTGYVQTGNGMAMLVGVVALVPALLGPTPATRWLSGAGSAGPPPSAARSSLPR